MHKSGQPKLKLIKFSFHDDSQKLKWTKCLLKPDYCKKIVEEFCMQGFCIVSLELKSKIFEK